MSQRGGLFKIAAKELAQALAFWIIQYLQWRALFLYQALMQEHHLARHVAGEVHLVGHHDHGAAFFGQALNYP